MCFCQVVLPMCPSSHFQGGASHNRPDNSILEGIKKKCILKPLYCQNSSSPNLTILKVNYCVQSMSGTAIYNFKNTLYIWAKFKQTSQEYFPSYPLQKQNKNNFDPSKI